VGPAQGHTLQPLILLQSRPHGPVFGAHPFFPQRSRYLWILTRLAQQEGATGTVAFEALDMNPDVLNVVIRFMYSGKRTSSKPMFVVTMEANRHRTVLS
jgi:hypothetical protein